MMLGPNIKAIREFKKISVQTVVKRLGLFTKKYLEIEKGLVKIDSILVKKIANILDVSESDIINFNKDEFDLKNKELSFRNLEQNISINTSESKPKSVIKPLLLTPSDILKRDLSNQAYTQNTFSAKDESDPFNFLIKTDEKSFSPRLLNIVEPYNIDGVTKSLFYTEFNTGLKVGERVFILNGVYDSNILIKSNKYKKGRDGYKVLWVDKCKLVLDINYTGLNPWNQENPLIGYSINLFYVKNEEDFKLVNRQITTLGESFNFKFNPNKHSLIYVDKDYDSVQGWGRSNGLIGAPGFFIKNGTSYWKNVTNEFLLGNLSSVISPNIPFNGRIKVCDGEFVYKLPNDEEIYFEEGKTYKFDIPEEQTITFPRWIVDTDYNRVFITKANFRNGIFKGIFNSGIFGNPDTEAKWIGSPAKWNSGTLLNSFWEKGEFNSIFTLEESYFSEINPLGNPVQKLNNFNNNGRGYSLIVDSIIDNMTINNATIVDSYFGETANYNVVSDYVKSSNTNFKTIIRKGFFINCLFENSSINNSLLVDSKTKNSKLTNVRSVSSNHTNVVVDDSAIINEQSIKVIGYEELNMSVNSTLNDITHKVYKFYINEVDFNRLKFGDFFYIENIKIDNHPLNFFDKKFRISSWTEYVDFYSGDVSNLPSDIPNNTFYKRGIEMAVFLSNPLDNTMLYNSVRISSSSINTRVIEENKNKLYSIDIVVSTYDIDNNKVVSSDKFPELLLDYNRTRTESTLSNLVMPSVLFNIILPNEIYLAKGDVESGIVNNTDWNAGNHIESNKDLLISIINNNGGEIDITLNSDKTLTVNTKPNPNFRELKINSIKQGHIVFINSLYANSIRLPDTYEIISFSDNDIRLKEVNSNILDSISIGSLISTNVDNRYNYLHLVKIQNSNIKKGLFNRAYLTNNTISNKTLNIDDKDFNDPRTKSLTITNSIFDNNGNILDKALFINSHFKKGTDKWINGIIFKSVWYDGDFDGGIIKTSKWLSGNFNNGIFYQSNSFNAKPNIVFNNIATNNIYSYFLKGITSPFNANNKWVWVNGDFNNGKFELSDFENGTFHDGEFYHSNFYGGLIKNGIIGTNKLTSSETQIFNAVIEYANVINANLIAKDTSLSGDDIKTIQWKNGEFNNGQFGTTDNSNAIWESGIFNGGQFTNNSKWLNGIFNNGIFNSSFRWDIADNSFDKEDYAWENGEFNGGIFGNGQTQENSTWHNGVFNNGKFIGRIWNNGVFSGGEFVGSGKIKISSSDTIDEKITNAQNFRNSFLSKYYGLWRNGIVTIEKDRFVKEKNIDNAVNIQSNFKNILWLNGVFSHSNGVFDSSVWLDGVFEKGIFSNSSFNPFISRSVSTPNTFSENTTWENGHLKNSDFYFSDWKDGKFTIGNSYGMIWHNGINEYMNAFNVWWKDGLWRNGNWYGSFMEYNGSLDNTTLNRFYKAIMNNIINRGKEDKVHIWNIFEEHSIKKILSSGSASPLQNSEVVLDTYYQIELCQGDQTIYYTDIQPITSTHIQNQRFEKNGTFYILLSTTAILTSTRPETYIDGLTLLSEQTNCPPLQTFYEIQSCLDNSLYYTNIPPILQNQTYVDNASVRYTRTQSSVITLFAPPSNFKSVTLISNQGCSTEPTTNQFISSSNISNKGTVFVLNVANFTIFIQGNPFISSPSTLSSFSTNTSKIDLSNVSSSNDTLQITIGGANSLPAFTNLRIRDNLGNIYSGVFQNGQNNIGTTTETKVISFNIGPAKGRTFTMNGGEINIGYTI